MERMRLDELRSGWDLDRHLQMQESETHQTKLDERDHLAFPSDLSSRSLASLILLAIYGEPPRSGWFASMICRCASLSCFLSCGPSLTKWIGRKCLRSTQDTVDLLEPQDSDGFLAVHLCLEATLDPLLCGILSAEHTPAHERPTGDRSGNGAKPDENRCSHE